jgi:hypothetical protein
VEISNILNSITDMAIILIIFLQSSQINRLSNALQDSIKYTINCVVRQEKINDELKDKTNKLIN